MNEYSAIGHIMKKIAILLICLGLSSTLHSQNKCKKKYMGLTPNGYIMDLDSNKISAYIVLKHNAKNQKKVVYYDFEGCEHTMLCDSMIEYKCNGSVYKKMLYQGEPYMLNVRIKGQISLYNYYSWHVHTSSIPAPPFIIIIPTISERLLYSVDGSELELLNTRKRYLIPLISKDKELTERLEKKGPLAKEVDDIITEYNRWYAANSNSFVSEKKEVVPMKIDSHAEKHSLLSDTSYSIVRDDIQISMKDSSYEAYYQRLGMVLHQLGLDSAELVKLYYSTHQLKSIGYQMNIINDDGEQELRRIGFWHSFYRAGTVSKISGYNIHGEKEGVWLDNDIDGDKYREITYKKGKKISKVMY